MSILDDVLQEEYERSKKMKVSIEGELQQMPKGYISRKTINKKPYCYIQQRIGSKVVSSYVPIGKVSDVKAQIERRQKLEASLKEVNLNMKKLKRVIK